MIVINGIQVNLSELNRILPNPNRFISKNYVKDNPKKALI